MPTKSILIGLASACALCSHADFVPIPLTPESYNQDVIVEKTAPRPVVTVTTASMDGGTNNIGFSWYERGYNTDSPATGLPNAGATLTSESLADHDYQFPPDYRSNNVVLLDSDVPAGTLALATPVAYASLSVLTSSGNGSSQLACTIHHLDGSSEPASFSSPSWFGPIGQAVTTYGCIEVQNFTYSVVHEQNPRLYGCDLPLTNHTSPVTAIDFLHVGGSGHAMIFALSGASAAGEAFAPVPVSGFNQDAVVEANAGRPGWLAGTTTATLERGAANLGRTFYERGYVTTVPASGLPAAGSTVTSAALPDHRYQMAPSYTANNAVLIEAGAPQAELQPASPGAFGTLSLLCAAAGGPVTNQCRVEHGDGTWEQLAVRVPDWLDAGPGAFDAAGRINVDTRFPDFPGSGAPRLFAVDLALTNSVSPITNLVMTFEGGVGLDARTVILAMSGRAGVVPASPVLTISRDGAGQLQLRSSAAGTLESATRLDGTNTVWRSEGAISGTVTVATAPGESGRFFRVRAGE